MDFQSFINTAEFKNLHPVKQKIIMELSNSGMTTSPEAMLPKLMAINNELKKRNLSFTKEESALLIKIMKADMTPDEQKKVDLLLGLFHL